MIIKTLEFVKNNLQIIPCCNTKTIRKGIENQNPMVQGKHTSDIILGLLKIKKTLIKELRLILKNANCCYLRMHVALCIDNSG